MSTHANPSYGNGSIAVGTTASKIATIPANAPFVTIYAAAAIYVGGPGVTTSGAQAGFPVAATTPFQVPSNLIAHDLYAVASSATTCLVLAPQ